MPPRHAHAIAHLQDADPVLGEWIRKAGPCSLGKERGGTHFASLARSIVYQQLSGKAAGTIHGRFHGLYGDRAPTPARGAKQHIAVKRVGQRLGAEIQQTRVLLRASRGPKHRAKASWIGQPKAVPRVELKIQMVVTTRRKRRPQQTQAS